MSQTQRVSRNNTTIRQEEGRRIVRLHHTDVVSFDENTVILNSGGWRTVTTKARMNQTSNQFDLGFTVHAENHKWYVRLRSGIVLEFVDGREFNQDAR